MEIETPGGCADSSRPRHSIPFAHPAEVEQRWEEGDRWADAGAGPPVLYRHRACGQISHVELRGAPMHADDIDLLAGPGAA